LALVSNLVQLHGGKVACSSEGPGKGSQFTVWLPRQEDKGTLKSKPR
jgi:signal transduction histidine kinase